MVGCFVRFVDNIQLEKLKQHDMRSYNEEMEVKIFFQDKSWRKYFRIKKCPLEVVFYVLDKFRCNSSNPNTFICKKTILFKFLP